MRKGSEGCHSPKCMPLKPICDQSKAKTDNSLSPNPSQSKQVNIQWVPIHPRYTLKDLILDSTTSNQLLDVISYYQNHDLIFHKWGLEERYASQDGLAVNLYGPPGTGKTMAAHAIVDALNAMVICVDYAEIESKYVGETSKNLSRLFQAAEEQNAVIFFDEADALLNENTAVVNEYIQKNLYSMDGIENKTYEIIDRIYEDIMNVSNAANVFPYADKYGTVINSMDDVVANYAHNIVYEDSLGTSLRDAIRISVEDDLLNDAHGYEYVTYDSLLSNAIVTIEFMVLDNQELHDALNERNIETIDSRYDFFSIAREYEDITY